MFYTSCFQHIRRCAHLLAQEVTDLHCAAIVLNNAVDGEMGVYGAHLVEEALDFAVVDHPQNHRTLNIDAPSLRR